MKSYNPARWLFSQVVAFIFKRRRFISLSLPTAEKHRIYDNKNGGIISISSRGASDVASIIQIFIAEFYNLRQLGQRFDDIMRIYTSIIAQGKTPLIIDCGANIGLTSLYFSMMFPRAKIVAIEPDINNCDFANINNTGRNVEVLCSAIGSRAGMCKILDANVDSNSFQVKVADLNSEPLVEDIEIFTVNNLLKKYEANHLPLIIKIDIEGFESNLFEKNTDWISRFALIIVELHDWMLPTQANSSNFLKEISKENRDFLFFNENIFSIKN